MLQATEQAQTESDSSSFQILLDMIEVRERWLMTPAKQARISYVWVVIRETFMGTYVLSQTYPRHLSHLILNLDTNEIS